MIGDVSFISIIVASLDDNDSRSTLEGARAPISRDNDKRMGAEDDGEYRQIFSAVLNGAAGRLYTWTILAVSRSLWLLARDQILFRAGAAIRARGIEKRAGITCSRVRTRAALR